MKTIRFFSVIRCCAIFLMMGMYHPRQTQQERTYQAPVQAQQPGGVRWNLLDHTRRGHESTQHGYNPNTAAGAAPPQYRQPEGIHEPVAPREREEEMVDITEATSQDLQGQPTIPIITTREQFENYQMLINWRVTQSDDIPGLVHICQLLKAIYSSQQMTPKSYNHVSMLLNSTLMPTTQFQTIVKHLIEIGLCDNLPNLAYIDIDPDIMGKLPGLPMSDLINCILAEYITKIKKWVDKSDYNKLTKSSLHIATLFHALRLAKIHEKTPHARPAQQILKLIMETIYQYRHYHIFWNRAPANFRLHLLALINKFHPETITATDTPATDDKFAQKSQFSEPASAQSQPRNEADVLIEQAFSRTKIFFAVRARKFLSSINETKETQESFPLYLPAEFTPEEARNITARTLYETEAGKLAFYIGCNKIIRDTHALFSFATSAICLYDANAHKHDDHIGRNIGFFMSAMYNKMNVFYTFTGWLGSTVYIIFHAFILISVIDYGTRRAQGSSAI